MGTTGGRGARLFGGDVRGGWGGLFMDVGRVQREGMGSSLEYDDVHSNRLLQDPL